MKGIGQALLCLGLWLTASAASAPAHWVGAWASSQQIPEDRNKLPDQDLRDATLRQLVYMSIGGNRLRVRLSNAFGIQPLLIDSAHVARSAGAGSAAIQPGSDRKLLFGGSQSVLIPAGADYWSDPVELAVPPLSTLTVTLHLPQPPAQQTSHPGSRATSYHVHGNRTADADLPGASTIEHWYQLAGVEVEASAGAGAIVTLGDSITDGHGATTNGNDRWPDALAARLKRDPQTRTLSVLNHGIGGNRLLLDGLGPNALARFDRDVLSQAGVKYLVVLEGINDLGTLTRDAPVSREAHADLVRRMISAYAQIVERARAHSMRVYGATILPDGASDYYHPNAQNEADRQAVNGWIRAPGHFDAVIDFDRVTRDPAHPERMRRDLDSGDGLHPDPAGYRAMAEAIPLTLFMR